MKALLCLLSQQHVPNLLSVHHFQPERLVLVESAGMARRHAARDFLEALRLGGRAYDDQRCQVVPLDDENSPQATRRCLDEAVQRLPDAQWIVNLTGGTKPMSIAAYEFFRERSARLVYTPVNRPNEFLDFRGGPGQQCAYRPTIQEFLAGYGFRFRRPLDKVIEEENQVRFLPPLAQLIAQRCTKAPLLCFNSAWAPEDCQKWRSVAREKGVQLAAGDVEIPNPEVRAAVCRAFNLQSEGSWLVGWLNKRAALFITGGWLEVLLWDLFSRHADRLGVWDVHLGLIVAHRDTGVANELDVALMHDYALASVECKSGAQTHDPSFDILYKVETVKHQFGALLADAYVATTAESVLETGRDGQQQVRAHLAQRAALYRCRIITREQIVQVAANPDDADLVRRTFFPSFTE